MQVVPLTFQQFMEVWEWHEIPNCPGRYTMTQKTQAMNMKEFMEATSASVKVHLDEWSLDSWTKVWGKGEVVRNILWVARLEGNCGIISYEHPSGAFLHTLNSASGMERKLRALHIYEAVFP